MERGNSRIITDVWLKENGWNVLTFSNVSNKDVNSITYYLVYENWYVLPAKEYAKKNLTSGDIVGDHSYTLQKSVALISTIEALEMLTLTGKEYDELSVVPVNSGDTLISRSWLRENGWRDTLTGCWHKCINDVWYEIEYTDFDCDYILKKEIARIKTVEELEELLK